MYFVFQEFGRLDWLDWWGWLMLLRLFCYLFAAVIFLCEVVFVLY